MYNGDNKNNINPFCPDAYSTLHVHLNNHYAILTRMLDICSSSADSDEMSHLTAFHLILHFLQEWHFTCIQKTKQKNFQQLNCSKKVFQMTIWISHD